jgi:hypothetical protein
MPTITVSSAGPLWPSEAGARCRPAGRPAGTGRGRVLVRGRDSRDSGWDTGRSLRWYGGFCRGRDIGRDVVVGRELDEGGAG